MTLRDSLSAGVSRAAYKRSSVALVVHLYGSTNQKRDDGGWLCSSGGAPVVLVGVPCPECGCGLCVGVPDECEGDAVCEYCGDRVGRVIRLSPPPKPPAVPEVKPSGLRWRVIEGELGSWWLYRGGVVGGIYQVNGMRGWRYEYYRSGLIAGCGTLAEAAHALVAAVRGGA